MIKHIKYYGGISVKKDLKSKLLRFLKKAWLPIVCFFIALVRFIINPIFSVGHWVLALVMALYLLISFNHDKTIRILRWKYNKDYAESMELIGKVILGSAMLVAAFLIT